MGGTHARVFHALAVAEGVVYSAWGARRGAAAGIWCLALSGRRTVHLTSRTARAGGWVDDGASAARYAFATACDRPSVTDAVAVSSTHEARWTGAVAHPFAVGFSCGTHALLAVDCRLATCRGEGGGERKEGERVELYMRDHL